MLQARTLQPIEQRSADVVAFPAKVDAGQAGFGRRPKTEPFSLVVDLANEEIGARWIRGAATLASLCGSALLLAPGFEPFAARAATAPTTMHNAQLNEIAAMQTLPALPAEEPPQSRGVAAGEKEGLKRISGDVSGGLYWSLRGAGASPELAAAYLKAIATRIDVGEVSPFDRFDFVVAKGSGALLYAGLDRFQGSDVEVMKWSVAGRSGWFDADATPQTSSGLMAPVAGRITSRFGARVHPILRYTRFHAGLDFGARWGSPIVAAADGQVVGAGWAGGYGRQVRIAHGGGIVTSYSHMSGIAAAPGMQVRQGQVIGYVGSSGLSTGPHLHFEVRSGGRAVNPLSVRLTSRPLLEGPQLAAFKAQRKRLLSIEMKRG